MAALVSYPMTITPLVEVRKRRDRNGRAFISFRAAVSAGDRKSERTVRAFGPRVEDNLKKLRKGIAVEGRFSFDSFDGDDGSHSQTLRIVSIAV